jgi:hypothetical protein
MRFKTERIKKEWNELNTKNPRLAFLISSISSKIELLFNITPMITMIYRTEEEQKELYKDTPNPPARSPHQDWNAVDLRSSDFTEDQINKIIDLFSKAGVDNLFAKTAIYHKIAGNAYHFHVQFKGK